MAAEADIEDGAPAKKGIPKLFIIIGAAAIVVLLGGAGLFVFLSAGSAPAGSPTTCRPGTPPSRP